VRLFRRLHCRGEMTVMTAQPVSGQSRTGGHSCRIEGDGISY
jgi:hypothetical protein